MGSFKISEGNITERGKKKKPRIRTKLQPPSVEVAQVLAPPHQLNREAQAAWIRVRTGPECPEDNLRELT